MKWIHGLLGAILFLATFVVLLITSFEIATYSDFGWYEKTYKKYEVCSDLDMEMKDVMHVTREMMSYLRGERDDLNVTTMISGEEQEFFNEREKAHMVDVQEMFLKGIELRRIAGITFVVGLFILIITKGKWYTVLPKAYLIGTGIMTVVLGGFTALVVTDFHKYFFLFHELFFDNDLWLLNPETDLLIRMLPEGFFADMVIRIGIIFGISILVLLVGSIIILLTQRKKFHIHYTNGKKCGKIDVLD